MLESPRWSYQQEVFLVVYIREKYLRKVMRGLVEFTMIEKGDRVMIGLSGGKDSLFLLYSLSQLAKELPFSIEIAALTLDLGFKESPHREEAVVQLEAHCQGLGLHHYFIETHIAQHAFEKGGDNPCAICSYFRRAVMCRFARERGFNKIALGHHLDDAAETLLLNLFYMGQLKAMQPVTFLDRSGVTIIRPLIHMREHEIEENLSLMGIEPLPTPCPVAGKTKRGVIKAFLRSRFDEGEDLVPNIIAAMRSGKAPSRLWPEEPSRDEIWQLFKEFWGKELNRI